MIAFVKTRERVALGCQWEPGQRLHGRMWFEFGQEETGLQQRGGSASHLPRGSVEFLLVDLVTQRYEEEGKRVRVQRQNRESWRGSFRLHRGLLERRSRAGHF